MGKQLFIPRSANTAKDSDFVAADLSAGEGALVYPTTSGKTVAFVSSDISDLDLDKPFNVIWRKANTSDVIQSTPDLTIREFTNAKTISYGAGTSQVTTVVLSDQVPSVTSKEDSYLLKIIKTTPDTANLDKWNIELTGELTSASIVTNFVSAINAELSDTFLTATSDATGGIALTAKYTSDHFRVACDSDLSGATISYATDCIPPSGTSAQIKDFEKYMKSHGEGITNTIWFPKDYTYETSDGGQYEVGVFDFNLKSPAKHGMNAINDSAYTLYVAAATSGGKSLTSDLMDLYTTKMKLS